MCDLDVFRDALRSLSAVDIPCCPWVFWRGLGGRNRSPDRAYPISGKVWCSWRAHDGRARSTRLGRPKFIKPRQIEWQWLNHGDGESVSLLDLPTAAERLGHATNTWSLAAGAGLNCMGLAPEPDRLSAHYRGLRASGKPTRTISIQRNFSKRGERADGAASRSSKG